jgi:Holliday junction resolvase RusA-like endonuclease
LKSYKFKLKDLRAISTNAATEYSKYGVAKSDNYRIFEAEFEIKMAKYKGALEEILERFDPASHCIYLEFKFYFDCQTKAGRLHKRAGDLTNMIKSTEDALFNYIGLDDAFVTEFKGYKIHSKKEAIEIQLHIRNYETI